MSDDSWVDTMPRCRNCGYTYRDHHQNYHGVSICPVEVNGEASQYGTGSQKEDE